MNSYLILPHYIRWHYSRGFADMQNIWLNILWSLYHFFSIPVILRTLISPWKRLQDDEYKGGFDIEAFFTSLVVNIMMRIVGFIMRVILLVIALVFFLVAFILGVVVFAIWLLLPFFILALISFGIAFLMP